MHAPTRSVFDVVTDFLASQPSDEALLAYRLPADSQARLDSLRQIDATSRLTAAQREELGDYRFVEDVLTRLRAKIKARLEREKGGNCAESQLESKHEETIADPNVQNEQNVQEETS